MATFTKFNGVSNECHYTLMHGGQVIFKHAPNI